MEYYKITNLSTEPCHMTWNTALFDDEDLKEYNEFKKTEDYFGRTEEDQIARKKIAEAIKMRPFLESLGRDVQIKVYDKEIIGEHSVIKPRYEWKFIIGPNIDKLIKDNNLAEARRVCEKYDIRVGRTDSVKMLTYKLKQKFGDNVRILNARQWLESGLKNREYKEIVMKLQPGELKPRIVNEGYLKAEPMTDVEVQEYFEREEKKIKEATEKIVTKKPKKK